MVEQPNFVLRDKLNRESSSGSFGHQPRFLLGFVNPFSRSKPHDEKVVKLFPQETSALVGEFRFVNRVPLASEADGQTVRPGKDDVVRQTGSARSSSHFFPVLSCDRRISSQGGGVNSGAGYCIHNLTGPQMGDRR